MLAKLQAQQLAHPSGPIGRLILAPMWNQRNAALNDVAFECLALRPDECVLEVGFGGGYLIGRMTAVVTTGCVAGVDSSQAMVDVCRRRLHLPIDTGQLELKCARAEALPYPADHFTKACTVNSIFYWENVQQALYELWRVLEPSGRLVMCFTCKESMQNRKFAQHGVALYERDQVERMLKSAGFRDTNFTRASDRHREFWMVVSQK